MPAQITISIPTTPEPEYAAKYRRSQAGQYVDSTRPILRVEVFDSKDGYGIVGEDMIPGRSITIRADKEYQARLTYLDGSGKADTPIFVYTHPQNTGQTHIAWVLEEGLERGGNLAGGKTIDLRDIWADGWIIEAKN